MSDIRVKANGLPPVEVIQFIVERLRRRLDDQVQASDSTISFRTTARSFLINSPVAWIDGGEIHLEQSDDDLFVVCHVRTRTGPLIMLLLSVVSLVVAAFDRPGGGNDWVFGPIGFLFMAGLTRVMPKSEFRGFIRYCVKQVKKRQKR